VISDPAAPRAATAHRPTDIGIEGVRGAAALFVGLSHLFYVNIATPALHLPALLRNLEAGHGGVLVFFVLSGYVISWTNTKACTPAAARSYVQRRSVRLVPIYMAAMLLTLVAIRVSGLAETSRVIIGSFLCLQNFNGYFGFSLNPPRANVPLWSLNFEVLYYGLFVILWRYRPSLGWVFLPTLAAGILGWFAPQIMPLFISSYACGWLFWASGWWLARQPILGEPRASTPLASWLLLVFASHHINGVVRVMNVFHLYSDDSGMVSIGDLGLIPSILLVLGAVTHRRLPHRGAIEATAWALCIVPISGMIWTHRLFSNAGWVVGAATTLLAVLLLPWRSTQWLRPFAWFGGISYAFYVVHYPLLYLVRSAPFPTSTWEGFAERSVVWVALAIGLSWLLEKRFQPWIKGRLMHSDKPST
jgi:peptidoglycan/LPS O-acetylase OafA/YrhL